MWPNSNPKILATTTKNIIERKCSQWRSEANRMIIKMIFDASTFTFFSEPIVPTTWQPNSWQIEIAFIPHPPAAECISTVFPTHIDYNVKLTKVSKKKDFTRLAFSRHLFECARKYLLQRYPILSKHNTS